MEAEVSSTGGRNKAVLQNKLSNHQATFRQLSDRVNKALLFNKDVVEMTQLEPNQKLNQLQSEVDETDQLINDIALTVNSTNEIAYSVNTTLQKGTDSLMDSMNKSQNVNSNIRTTTMSLGVLNRKKTIDKCTLWLISFLLLIVDMLALYLKLQQ